MKNNKYNEINIKYNINRKYSEYIKLFGKAFMGANPQKMKHEQLAL